MKVKRTEGKPRIAILGTPMTILADFTEIEVVEVSDEVGEYLVQNGYEEAGGQPRTKADFAEALTAMGVEFDPALNKSELVAIYEENTKE